RGRGGDDARLRGPGWQVAGDARMAGPGDGTTASKMTNAPPMPHQCPTNDQGMTNGKCRMMKGGAPIVITHLVLTHSLVIGGALVGHPSFPEGPTCAAG